MADITPVTREEFYLAKAGGQDVPVPSAVTREEYYLEKLSNDSVAVPSPVTRREKFLYFACGGEIDLPSEEKMTRLERLIAKAGGMDVSTPTAVTRLEKFWAKVEGGGWKTITGVLPLTFTAKGGAAVDWVIEGNDDVGENLFDKSTALIDYRVASYGIQELEGYACSDFIEVTAGENITVSQRPPIPNFYFYDSEQTFLSNTSGFTSIVPNNAKYVRCNLLKETLDTLMLVKGSTAPDHYIPYQQGVGEQRVDGYYVPLTISQVGQPDKTVDIYIGDSPLTEGETVSKASTGVNIELFEGSNIVSTTLYNKPNTSVTYKSSER